MKAGGKAKVIEVSGRDNVGFALLIMVIALLGILYVFGRHMQRILNDVAQGETSFNLADGETRMNFTIAERDAGTRQECE